MQRTMIHSLTIAVVTSMFAVSVAYAYPVRFELDPTRSNAVVCEPSGLLVALGGEATGRVFLDGEFIVAFDDATPVPPSGTSAFEVPSALISGEQDNPGFVLINNFSLSTFGHDVSSGEIEAVALPGEDTFTIDIFNYDVFADLTIGTFGDFFFLETFSETLPGDEPDFVANFTGIGGGDCDLSDFCTFSNDPGGALPSQAALDAACLGGTFCGLNDYCVTSSFDTTLGPVSIQIKTVLNATSRTRLAPADPSLLLRNSPSSFLELWRLDGASVIETIALPFVPQATLVSGGGDFAYDSYTDVVIIEPSFRLVAVLSLDQDGFVDARYIASLPDELSLVGIGDMNGDAYHDIIVRNMNTGAFTVWLMEEGEIASVVSMGTLPLDYAFVDVGDFDGDGDNDLLVRHTTSGIYSLVTMDGTTMMTVDGITGGASTLITGDVADFNADGKADLLLLDTASGALYVLIMDGFVIQSSAVVANLTGWDLAGATDTDGDDKADLIMRDNATGSVFRVKMDGTTIVSSDFMDTLSQDFEFKSVNP